MRLNRSQYPGASRTFSIGGSSELAGVARVESEEWVDAVRRARAESWVGLESPCQERAGRVRDGPRRAVPPFPAVDLVNLAAITQLVLDK